LKKGHEGHRVKFNGGDPICLDCDEYMNEEPPAQRVFSAERLPDGTYAVKP
jgi:hypothetical protein